MLVTVTVFQHLQLNLTILILVCNELADLWGRSQWNGQKAWTGLTSYLSGGTNFGNLICWKKSRLQTRNNHLSGLTWTMGKFGSHFHGQQFHSLLLKKQKVRWSPSQMQKTGGQIIISWRKSMKTSLMNAYCCCLDELSPLTFSEEEVLGDYRKVFCDLETWMEWTVSLGLSLNCCVFFFWGGSLKNNFVFVLSVGRQRRVENTKRWECD